MKKFILFFAVCFVCSALLSAQQKADALALYRAGKYAESEAVCIQELQVNPRNIDSYVVLCWSLVKDKKYADAETYALEGRKYDASDIRLIEILGEARYYMGKNASALELFQLYIASGKTNSPRLGNAYYFMGEIYILQKKYLHADISLSAAVRTEPTVSRWWSRCGYAREMAGYYQSSYEAYEKSLALDANLLDAQRGKNRVARRLKISTN